MGKRRFDRLMKRLSTGELTGAERRELDELSADNDPLRAEVRRTEALLAAAHESMVEQPDSFEWAVFSSQLKATIAAEQPRPYGRLALWLDRLAAMLAPRRVAVAASAVVVAVAVLVAVVSFRPAARPEIRTAGQDIAEPDWEWEEFAQYYPATETLPDPDLLGAEQRFWEEMYKVEEVLEEAPSFNGYGDADEAYILG